MKVFCIRRGVTYEGRDILSIHFTPEGAIKYLKETLDTYSPVGHIYSEMPNEEIFGMKRHDIEYTIEEWEIKE